MNFLRKSLSLEIENFVKHIRTIIGKGVYSNFTKSAFVQCRNKIQPEVFKHLSNRLIQEYYTDNDDSVKLWNGLRLLSVDGSRMTLPNTKELAIEYGTTKNQSDTGVVQGRVSVLYDVLNKYVLDGILSPLKVGESVSAIKHLHYSKQNDLIIYDRGYPSFNLIFEHSERKIDFLIRVRKNFSKITRAFYESGNNSEVVKIYPNKNKKITNKLYNKETFIEVRLVRVKLPR